MYDGRGVYSGVGRPLRENVPRLQNIGARGRGVKTIDGSSDATPRGGAAAGRLLGRGGVSTEICTGVSGARGVPAEIRGDELARGGVSTRFGRVEKARGRGRCNREQARVPLARP